MMTDVRLTDKHPAIQIYEIMEMINDAAQSSPGTPVSLIWMSNIFEEHDFFNSEWFNLMKLVDELEKDIERNADIEEVRREQAFRNIEKCKELVYQMNIIDGERFMAMYNRAGLSNLVLIPVGNLETESILTQNDLDSIQSQITELISSVRASSLPGEVKRNLFDALYDLMDIIEDYDSYSVADLEKATERYIGVVSRHNSELEITPSEEGSVSLKEELHKFGWGLVNKFRWKVPKKAIEARFDRILESLPPSGM